MFFFKILFFFVKICFSNRIFLFLVGSRALNGRSTLNLCAAAGLAALLMAFAFVDYVCLGVFFLGLLGFLFFLLFFLVFWFFGSGSSFLSRLYSFLFEFFRFVIS